MDRYAAYLLVHPERYPGHDPGDIAGELDDLAYAQTGNFGAAYGAMVERVSGQADRRVVILDPSDVESLVETGGWEGLLDEDIPFSGPEALAAIAQAAATPGGREHLQLTEGVPACGWELHEAYPGRVAHTGRDALKDLPAGARVLVGGYARHDCVKRTCDTLRRHGLDAQVCDVTALPLVSVDAILSYPKAT